MKLRVGKIPYANLFPIFYKLQRESDCSAYEFIEGVPSDLNRRIRSGEIDVCPSSSIEYLRNRDSYDLIENHSISSKGPVGSIILFSRMLIGELNGRTILTSSQSETSVALIQIVLKKFYGLDCAFRTASEPIEQVIRSHSAYLLIGDEALTEALRWPGLHVYDVGDLWYRHTGLPFTFALWMVRKTGNAEKAALLRKFTSDLDKAKISALNDLLTIADASPLKRLLSVEGLISYWKAISYDFGDEHKRGFELFRRYSEELGLLQGGG